MQARDTQYRRKKIQKILKRELDLFVKRWVMSAAGIYQVPSNPNIKGSKGKTPNWDEREGFKPVHPQELRTHTKEISSLTFVLM